MGGLITDIRVGLAFCTTLPRAHKARVSGEDIARAGWTLPLIGVAVGAAGALAYWLAEAWGLHPIVSGTLAVAATLIATGALHEDGLADTADGFGGGTTRKRKLEIMRDSRIGTYGAAALILSLMLRAGAVASLTEVTLVALALIAAHAGARAGLPFLMRALPVARQDGLSAGAGKPPVASVIVALALGLIALGLCLGPMGALVAALLAAAATGLVAWLAIRQIGGQTGDVLGAAEQAAEIAILLIAAVWL